MTHPASVTEIAAVPRPPIPKLRKDLEAHPRQNGTVDVRDPFLLQIYTLDAGDWRIANRFDGSNALVIAERLRAEDPTMTAGRVQEVADEFEELKLLDTPEVWESEKNIDNVQPYSQIDTKRGLTVLPSADDGAKWTCHGCGICCHGLAVEISKEEESRIDPRLYQDLLKGDHFAEDSFLNPDEPAKRTLRQRADDNNACIFLSPEGLCHVHARQGMEAKPDACQMFPAMVMILPNGEPPRLGLRTNCASMYKSHEDGPAVSGLVPHIMRVLAKGEVHRAPKRVRMFGRSYAWTTMDRLCQLARTAFETHGLNAETILAFDREHLAGRVRRAQRKYGRHMLAYVEKERSGPAPVTEGAYNLQLRRLRRGHAAMEAMKAGERPEPVPARVEAFLRAQINHVLYIGGPLNLPDAGYGLVGIMLGLLGALHAIGPRGTLKTANVAFEVFMMPLLETMEHAWPILDAVDAPYAKRLRAELEG